ncbi:MAG: hypothetical protein MI806_07075 [Minwuiales bacterium]|nr:hypothetical protein [Minwuiales bacterium]
MAAPLHKAAAAALALALLGGTAKAQGLLSDSRWLPPGSDLAASLSSEPREILRVTEAGGKEPFLVGLGRLAFRSPLLLGGEARRLGLSCDTCHTGGGANTRFFVAGVSDMPGNVDGAHRFFNLKADDGRDRSANIPDLRGVRWRGPYGHDGRFWSLREFTRDVVVTEFAGDDPPVVVLDALVAYQNELDQPTNPNLGPNGALTDLAPDTARRGEALFRRDCAGCHIPSAGFVDRLNHDVGTGERIDTPTLLGLAVTAPYMHDGGAADLGAVVDHFDDLLGLGYDADEKRDLMAYLDAVGAVAEPEVPITLDRDLARVRAFAGLAMTPLQDEDPALTDLIVELTRFEIGRIFERFHRRDHEPAQRLLIRWSRTLGDIAGLAHDRKFAAARAALADWQATLDKERPNLDGAAGTSLYNPDVLAKAG